jgi:hypothetical protein
MPPTIKGSPSLRVDERPFLWLGVALPIAILLYFVPSSAAGDPVELGAVSPVPAAAAPAPIPAPTSATIATHAGAAGGAGLVLHGVLGGGAGGGAAIIAAGAGPQRLVPVGSEAAPGLVLKSVGLRDVLLSSGDGDLRLALNMSGGAISVPPAVAPPAAGTHGGQELQNHPELADRRTTVAFRLGLQPRKTNERITGFAFRPGADLPVLVRAGLKPGDVLLAVNGQALESEEKIFELSREIAGSYTAEFEFERGGKKMKTFLEVNRRTPR